MTISEVARIAGVSVTTVSRVINNSDSVKLDNRLRVQAIIEQTQYQPNLYAQYLGRKSAGKEKTQFENPKNF